MQREGDEGVQLVQPAPTLGRESFEGGRQGHSMIRYLQLVRCQSTEVTGEIRTHTPVAHVNPRAADCLAVLLRGRPTRRFCGHLNHSQAGRRNDPVPGVKTPIRYNLPSSGASGMAT